MKTIEAKVQVDTDRMVTIQLPTDVQAGQYDVVLVINSSTDIKQDTDKEQTDDLMLDAWDKWVEGVKNLPLLPLPGEKWSQETADAWEKIQAEVSETKKEPQPVQNEYHQALIEKYRKQGLIL